MANLATMGRARKYNLMTGGSKESAPAGDDPRVRIMRQGDRTAIGTVIFFPDDGAELVVQHKQDLQRLALEITGKPQIIEIRGHTNLRPAADFTTYKDNWELAYARSHATMEFLVQELGIDSKRIRISVAAANEPLHIGTNLEQLKRNSRVEIFLTDEIVEDRTGTEEERQGKFTKGLGT
jgi:chemotaxis protein MotB